MNHIYKVIWNTITQTWVAVSELSRAKGKTKSKKILSTAAVMAVSAVGVSTNVEAAVNYTTGTTYGNGMAIGSSSNANTNATAYGHEANARALEDVAIGYKTISGSPVSGSTSHSSAQASVAVGTHANATHVATTAIGAHANAINNFATAVGAGAQATAENGSAFGQGATATGVYATALGKGALAKQDYSVALGKEAVANTQLTTSIGSKTNATGFSAIAIGSGHVPPGNSTIENIQGAQATADDAMAVGASALANKTGATALGKLSKATNNNAVAVGPDSVASGSWATATGASSKASGQASAAFGESATASGKKSIATGSHASASAENAIAIGNSTKAQANNTIAIGNGTKAQANNTIAIGNDTKATDKSGNSLVIGQGAVVNATDATVVGPVAQANGANATAVGRGAAANGIESTALGRGATATGNQTVALGQGAKAEVDSGVALGDGAVANRIARSQDGIVINNNSPSQSKGFNTENSVYAPVRLVDAPGALTAIKNTIKGNKGAVSVGDSGNTRQIINVAPGSADSDAVNVAQLKAVEGSIKRYSVTSPDGSITITTPMPGQDPQNFQISMNTTKVQDAAKWYVKEGTEPSGTAVIGGNTVSFNDSSTVDVQHNNRNFTFNVKSGDVTTNTNTGAITAPTDGNVLAKAKNVAEAIQRSGWELQANGTKVGLINPGDKVNIKAGTGVTITPTNETAGVSTLTISAAQQNYSWKLKEDSQTPAQALNVTNNTAVSLKGENFLNITNKGGGNFAFKTVTKDVAYTATTGEVNAVSSATGLVTNKNLSDVIRNSGFQLKENGTLKNVVNPGESLNFKPGQGTKVSVSANGDVQVNADTGSIVEVSPSENADNTPKKGQVKAGSNDENKIATVSNVANAINKAKWFAKADNNGGEIADNAKTNDAENEDGQAMSAGDKLTLKAGKNLRVKRDGANFTFATNNDVTFNKVTSNEVAISNGGNFTVGSGATINMGNNVVGGVANGVKDTDAVNVAQLKANTTTVAAGKNVTVTPEITDNGRKYTVDAEKSIVTATGPVSVTPASDNTEHTTTYNVGLNIDNDSLVVEGGKLKAKTQTQAVESVEKKEGNDNIAEVDVKSGSTKGAANAVYTVAVTKSAVKEAAAWKLKAENGEAQTVSGGDTVTFKNSDTINATVSADKEVTLTANTGSIVEVSPSENADNTPKKGQVKAGSNDENKIATVSNVANAINKAKWFAKADNNGGEIADNAKTNDAENEDGQAMSAGDKLTLKAGKNLRVKRDGANFTFATNNDVTFNKVTSNEVAISNGGNFTVGSGATINMGNNVVGGVANGVKDTDAVNVAQLKANTTTVAAGKNVTVTPEITDNGRKYTVDAEKSIVTATGPVSVTPASDNTEHTTTYNVGLNIDNDSLVVEGGKLKAKIKDYSFKTNATGSNVVGTDTTVASGKSVNFAASDNLTLKQDVNDGNVTYTYGLKNQVVVGEKGTPGADGKPGVDGSIGVNGKDGSAVAINGKDGSIGLNGKNGENGLTIKGDKGAVGVDGTNGKDGKDGMTRIVYTDNNNVKHEVATLDDGVKYAGDDAQPGNGQTEHQKDKVIAKKLNNIIDIIGGADKGKLSDKNIGVNNVDGKLKVQLAKELKGLTSAEFKDGDDKTKTEITHNGITITPVNPANGKTAVTLTDKGLNNGGNKITHVAEGTDDNDAVNVKQLKTFKDEVGGYGWNLSVNNGESSSKITKDTTVDLNNDDGNIKIAKNGSNVTLSLGPDVGLGKAGKDGKDGSLAVRGKDGASVEISGKDGSIGLTGPKGKDGTPGASATITVEKGTTTVNDDRDGGKEVTRIVYTDKDKNGKDIKREVATLDDGLKFKGDSKEVIKRTLGSQMDITGGADENKLTDKNIGVVYDKATNGLKVKLSKDVNLGNNGTITIGDTVVNKDGLTINGGPSVTKGGVNAGNQSVTNVKDGVADNDAVNVKQLKAAKTEVEAGDDHINVTSTTGANGQTIYKVSAKGINDTSAAVKGGSDHVKVTKAANTHKDGSTTVTDYTVDLSDKTKGDIGKGVKAYDKVTNEGLTFNADKGSTGVKKLGSNVAVNGDGKNITTTADENGVKVSMKDDIKVNSVTAKEVKVGDVNINENGINAGGKRITNVAPGKDGTDAVNVNQLKYVAGNISNQINNVDKGLRAGIAGALASGGLYHVTTAGKSMVSVGAGTYRGQNALAVGYSRLSDNGKVGVKFTVNSNSQGHAGASASVGYQW